LILPRQSVRFRLTLWYVGSLTLVLLLFALGVYELVAWSFRRQAEQQAVHALEEVADAFREGGDELSEIEHHGVVTYFHLAGAESVVHQSDEWRRNQLSGFLAGVSLGEIRLVETAGGDSFLLSSGLVPGTEPPVTATVAISQRMVHASLRTLAWTLVIALPVAILLAAIGGHRLAKRALAPISAITSKAREITATRLEERLPVLNPDDEFGQLAMVFNEVLGRLQESFERLKRFTSDASHEMRTPLTAMRSVGEVALHDHLQPNQYREVIGSMLEEGDRLTRLLESLLTLARLDQGHLHLSPKTIDASALARETGELMRSLTEEREQTLTVEANGALMVEADSDSLRQALVNLLDNAIKYTPTGGAIRLRTYLAPSDEVIIEVSDTGPGIASEHQTKVFDRFYRIDKARARETGGVGLGLALASSAVKLNGGRIELESELGKGSAFRVVLPGLVALQGNRGGTVSPASPRQGENI
jgi:heavy metal sensor kinase